MNTKIIFINLILKLCKHRRFGMEVKHFLETEKSAQIPKETSSFQAFFGR